MHYTIDYSKSPAKAFDAVEDIRDYLGRKRYDLLKVEMGKVKHCGQFAMYCSLAGIHGYPVIAWYEHCQGQSSWKPEQLDDLT